MPAKFLPGFYFAITTIASTFLLVSAMANEETIHIELNKLETQDKACRAYLVLKNDTALDIKAFQLDLVLFDSDGLIANRLALDLAPLPIAKTSVKLFDIPETSCATVGQLLLNSILRCETDSGPIDNCLRLITLGARGNAGFIK